MSDKSRNVDKRTESDKPVWLYSCIAFIQRNSGFLLVVILAALAVYVLIRPRLANDFKQIYIDQPSPKTVFAPFDFEFVDQLASENKYEEAASKINPVYKNNPDNLTSFLSNLQKIRTLAIDAQKKDEQTIDDWAREVVTASQLSLQNQKYSIDSTSQNHPQTTYQALYEFRQYEPFWSAIEENINTAMGQGIADNVLPIRTTQLAKNTNENQKPVVIQIISPEGIERASFAGQEVFTFDKFLQRFDLLLQSEFSGFEKIDSLRLFAADCIKAAYSGPTLTYQTAETEQRKSESRSRVEPIVKRISQGEIIVGFSEIVTQEHTVVLQEMIERLQVSLPGEIGYFILAFFFVISIWMYIYLFHHDSIFDIRPMIVILFTILLQLLFARISSYFSLIEMGTFRFEHAEFGVPLGMLGVILTILFEPRFAIFCCAVTSLYTGFIFGNSVSGLAIVPVVVAAVTSFGAVYTISHIRQRSDMYRAGGIVIIIASMLIIANVLVEMDDLHDIASIADSLKWALMWGTINGCLVSILSISMLPIFEDILGITTDIKLLELSQRNELLQRLEDEAPGSYQHTMRVATLAESAAEEIGANALLTRVGAYYHDVGKMVKPLYFVENQQTKADRAKHSKISTNMSCMIIRNHVKHGLEIGKQYKLPKDILDFIPEHHGTTLMTYFYHEALAEQEKEGTVKEDDFRYPGPKPQSKETAILMLSDALEATSRTLEQVTERDIRQLVRKIINDRFMDGQFDECNLTLKDLHLLYHSFSESLLHTLHQRIAYPDKPTLEKVIDKSEAAKEETSNNEIAQNENDGKLDQKKEPIEEEVKPVAIK